MDLISADLVCVMMMDKHPRKPTPQEARLLLAPQGAAPASIACGQPPCRPWSRPGAAPPLSLPGGVLMPSLSDMPASPPPLF